MRSRSLFTSALFMIVSSLVPASYPQSASSQGTAASQAPDWQEAAGGKMQFDVVSVKQDTNDQSPQSVHSNIPLGPQNLFTPTGGLLSATNFPLAAYMVFAYKLTNEQVQSVLTELPKWAQTDRWDIDARAEGNPTKDQYRLMMQALLADRFRLALHYETKQVSVLALVVDKPGKLGPQIQQHPADVPCPTTVPGASAPGTVETVAGGFPAPCGTVIAWPSSAQGRFNAGARGISMTMVAGTFSSQPVLNLDKPVVDRTGLSGNFDFVMEFSPEVPPGAQFQSDPTGPTFLEALKEQLGLKLENQTGPISSIVVDHIEQPTQN